MTKAVQKITLSPSRDIPFNKLALSQSNVRHVKAGVSIEQLAERIAQRILSTPERALLELLDELPTHETFHQVDMLMQGLTSLSPRRLKKLLLDCKSVKVKRLFFFFADRHAPSWLKALKKDDFDLGAGKRLLVKGGKFNQAYQITVPEDLNGVL